MISRAHLFDGSDIILLAGSASLRSLSRRTQQMGSDDDSAVPMTGHSQESRNAAVKAVIKGLEELGGVVFFEKALTSSDASGSGRVVIPKVEIQTTSCGMRGMSHVHMHDMRP